MKSKPKNCAGFALVLLGHLAAVTGIGVGITFLVMPIRHAQGVASTILSVEHVWQMSTMAIALHVALSACVWALTCIVYQLARLRIAERRSKEVRPMKLSRGSVMTETVVIMPIFLLLTFGMAQLAVNNIGGILANVAAYQAARAAWVWQPEVAPAQADRRMGMPDNTADEKCRIAVAFVMMPIAPGDYAKVPTLDSTFANRARMLAVGAHVPGGGVLSTLVPAEVMSLTETVVAGLGAGESLPGDSSYALSLDGSAFWLRTIRKFTTAYLATTCTINEEDHSVRFDYRHHNMMPGVGMVFGTYDLSGPGMLPGYYSTYTRTFGFRRQVNTPNRNMPQNEWLNPPTYPDGAFDPEAECTGDCP